MSGRSERPTFGMPLHNLPVRSKLALMFVAVCLVTFGVGGYLASASATEVIEGEIQTRLEYQSRAYATALDGYLRMLTRRSEDFASDGFIRDHAEALASGGEDRERIERELRTHLLENKLPLVSAFLDLTLIAPDGEILLAARAAPPEKFARRLAAEHRGDGPWCSELLRPGADSDHPRLAIATPLWSLDRTERLGDLVAWVHPSVWIVDSLRSGGFTEADEQGEVSLQLLDTAGHLLQVSNQLTDPNGPLADSELVQSGFGLQLATAETARTSGASGASSGSGRDVFQKSFPIAANGWSVRVALQGEDMLSAAADLQSRILGIGILLSIAASLLFLFPMRFLTRPLLDLAAAARRLTGGDLAARVETLTNDEIGDLGKSFNTMAEAIQERAEHLERTAKDLRTRKFELGFERDRLEAVIASMRDGLVVLDADGVPVLHNAAAGPLLKQVRSGHSSVSAYHRCENAESTHTECRECLFSPIVGPRSCVVEIDGGVFEIHAARLAPDAKGRAGRVLVSRDLTDRVAQDERHIHQERLAVLGEVAAVMAHELNNPLAAISMYNQMLTTELGDRPDLSENVDVIQRNVDSCKRTIRDLLDYATNATPEIGSLDVNATLEDVSSFLRPLRERSNVELRMNLMEDPIEVTGDEVQIRQVFVNLIVNAIQAVDASDGWVSVETRVEGDHAVVLVRDNGPGIGSAVREKIFKPFFTTKERGEGTGLGLPTARRIAEMHGGGLELLDEDGPGTVFRVRLRLYQEAAA